MTKSNATNAAMPGHLILRTKTYAPNVALLWMRTRHGYLLHLPR